MKQLLYGIATATLFTAVMGSTAFGAAEVEFVDGANTILITDTGTETCSNGNCSLWGVGAATVSAGNISVTITNFLGWDIKNFTGGASLNCSPGMQCSSDSTLTTQSTGAGTLTTFFADSGFTTETGFSTSLSAAGDSGGTTVSSAYYAYTGALDLGAPPSGPIGATLSLGSGTGSLTGGSPNPVGAANPFDLQTEVILTSTGAGENFNATSAIDAVPEPSSIVLFGTVLLGLGAIGRRRKKGSVA